MKWNFVENLEKESYITSVEQALAIRFPKSFTNLVKEFNHGTPSPNTFDTELLTGKSFGELLNFNLDQEYHILNEYELIKDKLPEGIYPFAADGGGNFICFDYRNIFKSEPKVYYWDHEQKFEVHDDELIINDAKEESEKYRLEFVADNLEEALQKLYEPEEEDDDEDAEILYNGIE
ncbi:SMI1/KNR4 family protein [Pedobacter sp. AW31-3R]|uniref:SMI1/KNR4 family protein n=1 Tax=Pedobacter sp. AW31-3R TaxID=3445781 RepID=UPI003F9F6721